MRRHLLRTSAFLLGFLAAMAAGYWVSARVGTETLRVEAQEQLGRILRGRVQIGRARVVIRGGLFLEGERVGVYPSPEIPHTPDLFASRVSAELDVVALLMGRFSLNSLTLYEARFDIERDAEGNWSPFPVQALAERRRAEDMEPMERRLDLIKVFDVVSRTLLRKPVAARRFEVHQSRVTFVDHYAPREGGEPVRLSLEDFEGRLVHHWLSRDADLLVRARFAHPGGHSIPIQVEGRQRRGEELHLALSADHFPLLTLEEYLRPEERTAFLDGEVSGEIAWHGRAEGDGTLEIRVMVEDLVSIVDLGDGHFEMKRPHVAVDADIDLHPGRLRLDRARIDAGGIELELRGAVERPLRERARMRVSAEVGGLELDDVREIVRSLPDADSATLERLLDRVHSGRIARFGGTGIASIEKWSHLVVGQADSLPRGFVLTASLDDIQLVPGETGQLSGLRAELEISGDRLTLRRATGEWNREPLPQLNLAIDGVSHLFQGQERTGLVTTRAGTLPGTGALMDILAGDDTVGVPEARTPISMLVRVETLDHPLLRWPVRDARILVEELERGVQLSIQEGRWASAPIRGEAVWLPEPESALSVDLVVSAPTPESASADAAPEASAGKGAEARPTVQDVADALAGIEPHEARGEAAWARGRFELERLDAGFVPMKDVRGRFSIAGTRLELTQVRSDLEPDGKLVSSLDVGLGESESVALAIKLSVVAGDVTAIGDAVGLPPRSASGKLHLAGRLEGAIRPQTPLLTDLRGELRLDARDGRIFRDEVPLLVALAQASEGYNQYAGESAIAYEHAKALLLFDRGRISTEDFQVEGPLRIYASGYADVVRPPFELMGVVGLFLFRGAGQLMETIPLVKAILPGSERGLVGAYYRVSGPFDAPVVVSLPGKTLEEDLPDVLVAPYQVLRALLGGQVPETTTRRDRRRLGPAKAWPQGEARKESRGPAPLPPDGG